MFSRNRMEELSRNDFSQLRAKYKTQIDALKQTKRAKGQVFARLDRVGLMQLMNSDFVKRCWRVDANIGPVAWYVRPRRADSRL